MQRSHSVSSINETDSERHVFGLYLRILLIIFRQTIAEFYAAKPLPPLPRGWSRVCQETSLLLRSIGLGIVVTAFQGVFTKNFQEPEKVAIRRSRVTALLRALIHAVPLGIAIFVIILNFKTRYVERELDEQNYVQFAPKTHEIAMQASLATILLFYIRLQLGAGKVMSFGAVLGDLEILQISHLWSSELWLSIFSKEFQRKKKLCFVSLTFLCVTIAATVGPSSANSLIARQGLGSTGSKYLALNATFQYIWPDQFNGEKINKGCAMIRCDSQTNVARCPVSEMYVKLDKYVHTSMVDFVVTKQVNMDFQSPGSNYDKSLLMSPCLTFENQMCATIPQAGLLYGSVHDAYYQATRSDLFGEFRRSDAYQTLRKNYHPPYTTASCILDVVNDGSDETPLRFPPISPTNSDLKSHRKIITIPGFTKAQIINDRSGANSSFHAHWIDLPRNIFRTGIPGAVIVIPQGPNGPPYNIYQCTTDAGWGSSAILNGFVQYGSIFSLRRNDPRKDSDVGASDPYGCVYSSVPEFTNISNLPFPERRISVSENWMTFITPTLLLADNSTTTFISRYLSSTRLQLEETRMLTIFLTIALSNTSDMGIHHHI